MGSVDGNKAIYFYNGNDTGAYIKWIESESSFQIDHQLELTGANAYITGDSLNLEAAYKAND